MKKYDYVQEVCKANKYLSLNPVVYEKPDDSDEPYRKVCMGCNLIEDGRCKYSKEECLVFQKAPEFKEKDKEWQLVVKKL